VLDPLNRSAMLMILPFNTYQAYNFWGGSSLYVLAGNGATFGEEEGPLRAAKVSFSRPYVRGAGAGDFSSWDIHLVRWLEREGFDVSYSTNTDMAGHPESLLNHQIVISGGHDEYWTKSMRDGMEAARDSGVSLAFFGANTCYWQARLESDSGGNADRTLVCYKVQTGAKDPSDVLTNDPLYPHQPDLVTALWRDPVVGRPENALLGLMYSSYIHYVLPHSKGYYLPDWVVRNGKPDSLLIGTGLKPGQPIKGGLLGYEYDAVHDNGHTPSNLAVLAQSPIINVAGKHDVAATAYYRAGSGAMVFDAGSIWWGWGLSEYTSPTAFQPNLLKGSQPIQNLTRNILLAMLAASPLAQTGAFTAPFL
jgi:hypothetical protein